MAGLAELTAASKNRAQDEIPTFFNVAEEKSIVICTRPASLHSSMRHNTVRTECCSSKKSELPKMNQNCIVKLR